MSDMSESSNIARPYAAAVFELAQSNNDLAGWGVRLEVLAAIAADAQVKPLANNPRVAAEQLQQLILEVAADILTAEQADGLNEHTINLIKLLVRNNRINALPNIARAYAAMCAESMRVIEAEMITAVEINQAQRAQFTAALQSKLGRTVKLEFGVDRALVGGAVVRAGDWVIDGSVRAQLEQLVGALRA